jgi:hypothetical protein
MSRSQPPTENALLYFSRPADPLAGDLDVKYRPDEREIEPRDDVLTLTTEPCPSQHLHVKLLASCQYLLSLYHG